LGEGVIRPGPVFAGNFFCRGCMKHEMGEGGGGRKI